ncbi:MAG TPA: iron-containing alcohol dehydrogenase, partial [Candidatus Dormibacteraeota bacterium]|nr:iron-containing alcohol dehydrogenase [Candidatus Dormibacteraeota bacterium]
MPSGDNVVNPQAYEPLPIRRVVSGRGAHRALGEELRGLDVARALLLTTRSLDGGVVVASVADAGGGAIAARFGGVSAHNPTSGVRAAAEAFAAARCDAIVALGGGSVIDCAKAVKHMLGGDFPLLDLPTTLSGAEWAASFGQTDDETRIKGGYRARELFADVVLLDVEVASQTPEWLWSSTGFRAIDHAVEAILADNAHPYLD